MTTLLASVNYLDLTICLIILLGIFLGAMRGFAKSIKKSFIIIVIIAMMLCSVVGNALQSTDLGNMLNETLTTKLAEVGGAAFSRPLFYINDTYYVFVNGKNVALTEALSSMDNPLINFVGLFIPMIMQGESGVSLLDKVVPFLSKAIFILGSFVLLCIILKIIFILINMLIQQILDKITILKWLDKLLGAIYSGIKSVLFVVVGMSVVSFVSGMDFQGASVLLEQINTSTIGLWLVENNVVNMIFSAVMSKG